MSKPSLMVRFILNVYVVRLWSVRVSDFQLSYVSYVSVNMLIVTICIIHKG